LKLDIIFRSCSRVYEFHGRVRVAQASKSELIIRCLRSLLRSAELARAERQDLSITLTVVDDHSHPDCVELMKRMLSGASFGTGFVAMDERTGNGPSLLTTYEHARENARELIYFVEDDYLHAESAILELTEAYNQFSSQLNSDVVLFPMDSPNLYSRHYPSGILLTSRRYWRNIGSTTGTLLVSRSTLLEHWEKYMGLTRYALDSGVSEENTINLVYRRVPCFSPMPTLAVHMGELEVISPFVDWKEWWDRNGPQDATG
jgi:hypothetical protein